MSQQPSDNNFGLFDGWEKENLKRNILQLALIALSIFIKFIALVKYLIIILAAFQNYN